MNSTRPGLERGAPGLDAAQARHAQRVHEHLAACIAAGGGWLSFEQFMGEALYAPGLGYYSAGARKLGPAGDFVTAPEISRLFGACLARQCAEVLHDLAAPVILEIGAGSGRLAADLLARLDALETLPARYLILEVSADLRERQRHTLQALPAPLARRVGWLDAPPAEPFEGVIVANEVLDALPVQRFRWGGARVEELGVALDGGRLVEQARAADAQLTQACLRLERAAGGWPEGYESEYCRRLPAFTASVTAALRKGAVLWIDYGLPGPQYYLPERRRGTLMCHFRHRAHEDPLLFPGLQDITAWVDFTHLAECSLGAGFALAGFATQSLWLAALRVDEEMRMMAQGDADKLMRLSGQARRLMMPGEMGERFKAMAWSRGLERPLSGFSLQDLRHTL